MNKEEEEEEEKERGKIASSLKQSATFVFAFANGIKREA